MTTKQIVDTIAIVITILAFFVLIGGFDQIGPISTERGMKRLGWTLVAIAFLTALTQSSHS